MKSILYITTTIPALSMTFVYREIEALIRAGYKIVTVSRSRPKESEISSEEWSLYERTFYLDRVHICTMLFAQCRLFFCKPRESLSLLTLIFREKEFKTFRDLPRTLYHLLQASYLYIQFKDRSISHVHAHILNAPTSIALFLSRYLGISFSFTMHGSQIYVDPLMLGTKLDLCKKAVTTSKFNRNFLLSKYGSRFMNKILVIHCGIDLEVYKSRRMKKANPPMILSVGRLVEVKGFPYLLEACSILSNKHLPFTCCIIGAGEEEHALKKMAKLLRIEHLVHFLGGQPQEKVRQILDKASIFVLASIVMDNGMREGIPVSLMEAMAMGLPVVSTNTVGIPELITHGKEGLLVLQKNPTELASAIGYLLINSEARKNFGNNARIKIRNEFNIEHIPKAFRHVFNNSSFSY